MVLKSMSGEAIWQPVSSLVCQSPAHASLWPNPPTSQSEGHPDDAGLRCQPTRAPNWFNENKDWFYSRGAKNNQHIPEDLVFLPPYKNLLSGFCYLTIPPPSTPQCCHLPVSLSTTAPNIITAISLCMWMTLLTI